MNEIPVSVGFPMLYPKQMAMVTSMSKEGKPNVLTIGWYMTTALDRPLLAISIGRSRYSHKLLWETLEFVLCVAKLPEQHDIAWYVGTCSGATVDKFADSRLKPLPAKHVRPPLIDGCEACFECKIVSELETGDHTIFVGEILAAYK